MKEKLPEFKPDWTQLLIDAVREPGRIMDAYRAFHSYSYGNQLLAMLQCQSQGLPVGPIASFKAWERKGRRIKKGSKAIALCMPVTFKKEANAETGSEEEFRRFFVFRRNWFVLAQTEGEAVEAPALPGWEKSRALSSLEVSEVPFEMMNGNVQGYASGRSVAINPIARFPMKTLFHELAHIVLGHTEAVAHDDETLPRNIKEVEAESVALLLCASLGHSESIEFSRGYIQSWLGSGGGIQDKSARRIFSAATKILEAGREKAEKSE